MRRYPHEASGGEKQRVVIATAFACRPELILFDEPTTALDVITARQILDLLRDLQAETAVASLYISHDLAVVSRIAQRVAVIHRGRIVDEGSVPNVFTAPRDSYTRALLDAVPKPKRRLVSSTVTTSEKRLVEVRGLTVRYGRPAILREDSRHGGRAGCLFRPRARGDPRDRGQVRVRQVDACPRPNWPCAFHRHTRCRWS